MQPGYGVTGLGFRDIISLVSTLPTADFNRLLGGLQDTDLTTLRSAKDVLVRRGRCSPEGRRTLDAVRQSDYALGNTAPIVTF